MPDVLVRGISRHTLDQLDRIAARKGLNRSELLRSLIEREAYDETSAVTVDDFASFSWLAADLENPEVMQKAWD